MQAIVVSTSLREGSLSRILALKAKEMLSEHASVIFFDLQENPLPICDGEVYTRDPRVRTLRETFSKGDFFVVAAPIYNYGVNAACKNLFELLDKKSLEQKLVSFLLAAAGEKSYMAPMGMMGSLMLDFRMWVNPRYVYALSRDFTEEKPSDALLERLEGLCDSSLKMAQAIKKGL